jgi:cytochrome b involved in lipid metabolism
LTFVIATVFKMNCQRLLFSRQKAASSLLCRKCFSFDLRFQCRALTCTSEQRNSRGNKQLTLPWNVLAAAVALTLITTSATAAVYSDDEQPKTEKTLPIIRRHTVEQYTSENTGIWATYNNGVYDLSKFIANHPGGKDKILLAAGKDLSELWQQSPYQLHYHSPLVFELLEEYRIGTLAPDEVIKDPHQHKDQSREAVRTYSTKRIYECIIVGSGLAGLQCANTLLQDCSKAITRKDVLILEASDYVGGRVKQVDSFVAGIPIDVGAEFLHGTNTMLAENALKAGDPLKELFCWAHGDGG